MDLAVVDREDLAKIYPSFLIITKMPATETISSVTKPEMVLPYKKRVISKVKKNMKLLIV